MTTAASIPFPDPHLRQTFAAQLPRRIDEIVHQMHALEVETWNPRRVDFLHRLVHSLSSSARSFGIDLLAEVAQPLEVNLARLLGRMQQPKPGELQRIIDAADALVQVAEAWLQSITGAHESEPPTASGAEQALIYIWGDIPEHMRNLRQTLIDAHYRAEVFHDADSLWQACKLNWPALLLIDLVQAELEAAALSWLRRAREQAPPSLQILMVTARGEVQTRLAMYRAGASHLLARPLQSATLLATVARLCLEGADGLPHIMLLFDDPQLQQACQLALQGQDMPCMVAQDLNHAMQLLEQQKVDLALLPASQAAQAALLSDLDPGLGVLLLGARTSGVQQECLHLPEHDAEWGMLAQIVIARARTQRRLHEIQRQLGRLRAEREREHEALNQHTPISITDPMGRITWINDRFCRVSGYARHELLGQNHRMLKSGEHDNAFFQDLWHSLNQGRIWHGQICNRDKQGGLYWLETTIAPFLDDEGRPWQFVSWRHDISADKQEARAHYEAQRKATLERDEEQLVWSELMSNLSLRQNQAIQEDDDDSVQSIVRFDGQIRYVRTVGLGHLGSDGRLLRSDTTVQDMAALHEMSSFNLDEANQVKPAFLQDMGRQLRAPINAILAYANLMQQDPGAARAAASVQQGAYEIARTGQQLLGLVSDVLDLARIESGQQQIHLAPVSLRQLFLSCESHVVGMAAANGVSIGFDLGECLDCEVIADAGCLHQVLLALIANGIKYNRPGGRVQVGCCLMPLDDTDTLSALTPRLQIAVSDTGYGLSADKLARLFTPFDRLGAEEGGSKGTGIGLLICRSLLHLMGGQLGVESTPGLGATFWLELNLSAASSRLPPPQVMEAAHTAPAQTDPEPLRVPHTPPQTRAEEVTLPAEPERIAAPVRPQEESMAPQAEIDASRKIILYIEDNAASQRLMHKVLARRGNLEMVEAVSAEAGLPLAEKLKPALILLDINLPGLDGYQALQQLRAIPGLQETPVVAVTANAMKGDAERGLAAGFTAYVAKPLDIEQFYVLLDHLLGE
ncbi:response regulator [Massilia sp. W12]|uniref:response regulator n=1 Tax=Massilia sp. W12 TaxID=3126507 RepID=UPI0030D3F30D